tara:strand:- start:221 stop:547 length:327 start_codon:yes stop_codon:yes gene_type:complete
MSNRFASMKRAIAECDICGFRYRLKELRNIIRKGNDTNLKACPYCFDYDHPQNELGMFPVHDPQAIRDPRPDFVGYAESRALKYSGSLDNKLEFVMTASLGSVTVSTS